MAAQTNTGNLFLVFFICQKEVQNVEKITDQVEVFDNDIEYFLQEFCELRDIDDMQAQSQNVWNGCMTYINRKVFNNTDKLKLKSSLTVLGNCNAYDIDVVNSVCDYYIYLCNVYDKEVSIIGFSKLTGINRDTIYDWGNNINKLSTRGCDVYKKLVEEREESLSSKLVTGKQNPVGVLGVLNRHYQWNMPGVSRETTKKQALTDDDLIRIGQKNGQIAQIPSDEVE